MRSAFVVAFSFAAVFSAATATSSAQDSQHGETVLALNQAPADAPARRHPKALWFELSNLRKEAGRPPFGGEIALDFRREEGTSVGWHDIVLVVKAAAGRREYRSIGPSPFAKEQGTVQGSSWSLFSDRLGDNLEVWLEQNQNIAGTQVRMKVSQSITLGSVGQLTYARHWTPNEQKAFDSWEKSTTPPPAPPAGYQLATAEMTLVPGMPILAGWMAAWQPAEVIEARTDGSVLVKFRDATTHLIVRPRNWISVESKILDSARTNPAQFKPSVKVLPGGTAPIPADLVAINAETPLVKGTPAKADWAGRWNDVTILEVHAGGKVRIHWDGYGSNWDEDKDRSLLLITQSTLDALKKPDAAEKFAKRADALAPGAFGGRGSFGEAAFGRNLRQYPISISIPQTAARVTDETPLEEGTKLGCSWGHRWYNVTVLTVHDDGTVKIRWDEFNSAWDGDIARDCLIIDKKVLAKLTSKAKKTPALRPVSPGESSGSDQFKVVLKGYGTAKIAVIKAVMDATSLDLKDAKEFVESSPVTLKQNLTKAAAEKLRADLQASGATVAIELQ